MTRRALAILAALPFLRPLLRAVCPHPCEEAKYRQTEWCEHLPAGPDGESRQRDTDRIVCGVCGMVSYEQEIWRMPVGWGHFIHESVWRSEWFDPASVPPVGELIWKRGFHWPA